LVIVKEDHYRHFSASLNHDETIDRLAAHTKCGVELARGIEPPTGGLQIFDDTPSDNPTPQETTNQDAGEMAKDGPALSCSGSSVVANFNSTNEDK
jgi:hypothetical protein